MPSHYFDAVFPGGGANECNRHRAPGAGLAGADRLLHDPQCHARPGARALSLRPSRASSAGATRSRSGRCAIARLAMLFIYELVLSGWRVAKASDLAEDGAEAWNLCLPAYRVDRDFEITLACQSDHA